MEIQLEKTPPTQPRDRGKRSPWRAVARAVLWVLFTLYLLLHVLGVIEEDRGLAIIGLLGIGVVSLSIWILAHA